MVEEEGYYLGLLIEWGKVIVIWWSYFIKGLYKNDFICVVKIDDVFVVL